MVKDLFPETTQKRLVIGLAGQAGVGKDTVAGIVRAATGCTLYAFAGPLKEALAVLGLPEPKSRTAKEAQIPGRNYSWREAAQKLGTEWARELDNDFWLNLAEQKVKDAKHVVFTDVRFENEATWVRSQGGQIWHISGRKTSVSGAAASHASETPLQFVSGDRSVDNSGSIADLERVVRQLILETCYGG